MARTLELDTITEPGNSSTANITLSSDTTTTMPKVDINGGAIDATTVGAATPSTVAATSLSTTGNATVGGDLTISGGNIKSSGGTTSISVSGANTTLAGTANNIGTVTAGTLGSAVVFPTGFCIKTHYYTDQTGAVPAGYTVTGTTRTAMTETLSVSVTSGNTYEISFNAQFEVKAPSDTNQCKGWVLMLAATSSTDIGDTFASNTTALTGHEAGRLDATDDEPDFGFRSHLVYPFVAGSTATQYFTIAGFTTVSTNTITLQASPLALTHGRYYLWRVKEFQGNCLTDNYGG